MPHYFGLLRDPGIKPLVIIRRGNDGRHAFVKWFHEFIGRHHDDAAAVQDLAVSLPSVPETGKGEHVSVSHADVVRYLLAVDHFPLVEAVRRDQAAPTLEGCTVGRLLGHGFDPGIDRGVLGLRLL